MRPYDLGDLQIIDPKVWVRRNPRMFFPQGVADPIILLGWVMCDVVTLTPGACTIRRADDWWVIGSDCDWLAHPDYSETELFARVVSMPARADNDMRAEVVVSGYARSVWTCLDGSRARIQGDEPPTSAWDQTLGLHRAVLFAM